MVVCGAGAAGLASAEHYVLLGVKRENITLVDIDGVVYRGREKSMDAYKARFAQETSLRTLAEVVRNCDVLVGLSAKGVFTPDMLRSMAPKPIIFAMANPDPEITYEEARAARPDAIVTTGRSDYPNQVNNVLGFPFIFRGALDVRASTINHEMELAATHALAALAKEDVPDSVCRAYGVERLHFGSDYIIPKPFDRRALVWVASAVAKAAMDTGVAQEHVALDEYREELERRLGKAHEIMRTIIHKAQALPKRVVFPEGDNDTILRACHILVDEKIARPVLLGDEYTICARAAELSVSLEGIKIIDVHTSELRDAYSQQFYELRQRRGVTLSEARNLILNRNLFASMMVHMGDADTLVSGVSQHFPDTIRPALQVIKVRPGVHKVAGLYVLVTRKGDLLFLGDCSVNIEPTAEELAEIALCAAEAARRFDVEPRIAMLSFSNFGSTRHPQCEKMRQATELVKQADPDLLVDGEIMADTAVSPEVMEKTYPFSRLRGGANVLIFPDLDSANIAYKLLVKVGGAEAVGPILMGMSKPVYVLPRGSEEEDVVNIAAMAVVDAQEASHLTEPTAEFATAE
jgi:malate dehydrogenase (oxaloacetate-decarboxylating)(NADP+)